MGAIGLVRSHGSSGGNMTFLERLRGEGRKRRAQNWVSSQSALGEQAGTWLASAVSRSLSGLVQATVENNARRQRS